VVAIELDMAHQQRLDQLAKSQGRDGAALAHQIVVDYLDLQASQNDAAEGWAEASIALTPEIMADENWSDSGHGSK